MNAQRKMDEDMSLDAIGKQKIVGVEKNDIWTGRSGESLERGPRFAPRCPCGG